MAAVNGKRKASEMNGSFHELPDLKTKKGNDGGRRSSIRGKSIKQIINNSISDIHVVLIFFSGRFTVTIAGAINKICSFIELWTK